MCHLLVSCCRKASNLKLSIPLTYAKSDNLPSPRSSLAFLHQSQNILFSHTSARAYLMSIQFETFVYVLFCHTLFRLCHLLSSFGFFPCTTSSLYFNFSKVAIFRPLSCFSQLFVSCFTYKLIVPSILYKHGPKYVLKAEHRS